MSKFELIMLAGNIGMDPAVAETKTPNELYDYICSSGSLSEYADMSDVYDIFGISKLLLKEEFRLRKACLHAQYVTGVFLPKIQTDLSSLLPCAQVLPVPACQ